MPEFCEPTLYRLPLTGKRNGHYKQLVGHATVLDDPFTRNVLAKLTWQRTKDGYPATTVRGPDGRTRQVTLHRLVYTHYRGSVPPGHEIDHRDRDKQNALPDNLRAVTRSVNAANKSKLRNNTTGYKGVSLHRPSGRYHAKVTFRGRQFHLGTFRDPRSAARAVNEAYREHFPEVPVPNPTAA